MPLKNGGVACRKFRAFPVCLRVIEPSDDANCFFNYVFGLPSLIMTTQLKSMPAPHYGNLGK